MDKYNNLEELDKIEKETKSLESLTYNLTLEYEKRYNILLTAICSGALILIFQILKEVIEKEISLFIKITLFSSLVIFSIALLLNLILPKIVQSEIEEISKIGRRLSAEIHKRKVSLQKNEETKLHEIPLNKNGYNLSKTIELIVFSLVLIGVIDLGIFFYLILFSSS
ncbi:MAG: hypothetical protein Q8O62_13760 [Aequorivita sp.]|nr:hypothetical protein [Aequorivita sp.]